MLHLSALRTAVDDWYRTVNDGHIVRPPYWERYPPADWVAERWLVYAGMWLTQRAVVYAASMKQLLGELMLFPLAVDPGAPWG